MANLKTSSPRLLSGGNTIATLGDSRVAQGFVSSKNHYSNGVIQWLRALSQQRFKVVYNGGVSGNRTDQVLARLGAALATNPGILFIWCGANDISQDYPTAGTSGVTAFTNIKSMAEQARLSGATPVVVMDTPVTDWDATQFAQLYELNQRLADYAYDTPGVLLFDMHRIVVDPTSATAGTIRSGHYGDATHVNITGAYYGGKELHALLSPAYPNALQRRRAGLADAYANNPLELVENGNFITTSGGSGSGSNGVSGTVPASWTVLQTASASGTMVVSTEAASVGVGNACVLTLSDVGSGEFAILKQDTTVSRAVARAQYVAVADVAISGSTNLEHVRLMAEFNNASGSTNNFDMYGEGLGGGIPDSEAITMTLRTEPITIPSGSLNWFTCHIRLRFNGAGGAAVIKVSNVSLRRYFS